MVALWQRSKTQTEAKTTTFLLFAITNIFGLLMPQNSSITCLVFCSYEEHHSLSSPLQKSRHNIIWGGQTRQE